jgi:hypothetical protein
MSLGGNLVVPISAERYANGLSISFAAAAEQMLEFSSADDPYASSDGPRDVVGVAPLL